MNEKIKSKRGQSAFDAPRDPPDSPWSGNNNASNPFGVYLRQAESTRRLSPRQMKERPCAGRGSRPGGRCVCPPGPRGDSRCSAGTSEKKAPNALGKASFAASESEATPFRFPGSSMYQANRLWYAHAMRNFLTGRLLFVRVCLLAGVLLLLLVGVLTIYAIGNPVEPSPADVKDIAQKAGLWKKQLVFIAFGLTGFVAANVMNYRRLGDLSYWIYGVVLGLLAYLVVSRYVVQLPFRRPNRNDVHRWLVFHPSLPQIQPSEFCKLAYVLALAWYLRYRSNYRSFRALIGPFAMTLLPMVLILIEPNLGTVLLMMPVFFAMLFVAGARPKHLVLVVLLAVLVSPVMWLKMHAYQRERISGVLLQSQWVRQKAEQNPTFSNILLGSQVHGTPLAERLGLSPHSLEIRHRLRRADRPGVRAGALHQVRLSARAAQRFHLRGDRPSVRLPGQSLLPGSLRRAGPVRVGDRVRTTSTPSPGWWPSESRRCSPSRCSSMWG